LDSSKFISDLFTVDKQNQRIQK